MRRALAVLALVVCTVGLAGCGDDDSGDAGDGKDLPTKTIDVTIDGRQRHAERRPGRGAGRTSRSSSWSRPTRRARSTSTPTPSTSSSTAPGTTTLPPFTIDKPGIVDVESHALEKTIVQLEVK